MKNGTNEKLNDLQTEVFSDEQKLQFIHGYIKHLIEINVLPNTKTDLKNFFRFNKIYSKEADPIFKFISDLYGCSNFPQVISNKKYKELEGAEYFRGFRSFDHIANSIAEHDRHYGWGMASSGMHSTENFDQALSYTTTMPDDKEDKKLVLKFKLDGNNVVSIKKLQNDFTSYYLSSRTLKGVSPKLVTLVEFLDTIFDDPIFDTGLYLEMFNQDAGKLGIILGYDAIDTKNWRSVTILNRSKMLIARSEYDRIIKNSKDYLDGKTIANPTESQPGE